MSQSLLVSSNTTAPPHELVDELVEERLPSPSACSPAPLTAAARFKRPHVLPVHACRHTHAPVRSLHRPFKLHPESSLQAGA